MGAESEDSETGPEEEAEAGPDDERAGAEGAEGARPEEEVEIGPDDEKVGAEGTGAKSESGRTEAGEEVGAELDEEETEAAGRRSSCVVSTVDFR